MQRDHLLNQQVEVTPAQFSVWYYGRIPAGIWVTRRPEAMPWAFRLPDGQRRCGRTDEHPSDPRRNDGGNPGKFSGQCPEGEIAAPLFQRRIQPKRRSKGFVPRNNLAVNAIVAWITREFVLFGMDNASKPDTCRRDAQSGRQPGSELSEGSDERSLRFPAPPFKPRR